MIKQGQIQDFPLWGGTNPRWRGHQPPTQALWGGAPETLYVDPPL